MSDDTPVRTVPIGPREREMAEYLDAMASAFTARFGVQYAWVKVCWREGGDAGSVTSRLCGSAETMLLYATMCEDTAREHRRQVVLRRDQT